ncbi:tRNA wybutosine-synthesizing protein 2 homolog isoform X1 [Mya arenaria]|uniref:tRNA wybutosine-synthesizing protein 2 homolog isoform X1 n=2 Tax=Mya arenaria TaxID=6604 RepID=UPI0022E13F49|nr:tRNA wybutosine-synthesizing protein 2 homolog isoform X1 [Mya arenaria]
MLTVFQQKYIAIMTDFCFVIEKQYVKELRSLLKQLQVNDDTRRLQSIAMTGKVAIPFRTKTQQKPEEVLAIVRSTLAASTCNENVPYIQVEPRQLPLVKKLLVKSPLQVLKGRLQKLVSDNGEAWTPDLETDLPTHWERHGDLALVPDTAFCLPIWSNIGGEVWHCVADSLSCTRLARKSRVLKDGFRRPSVTLLYGDNGWVKQVDNGIRYSYDITRCMFSAGNITEKLRVASFDCRGETVVDLYAGIGYFTLPFLMYTGVAHVYACEWNPDAVEALKQNLRLNKVQDSCTVLFGDNRKVCPVGVADRVNLGLIPSSRDGWPVACRALKPTTGGILHIHHNVNTMSRQVGVTDMGCVQDHTWEQLDNAGYSRKHTKLKSDDCCGHNINTRHRQVGLDTGKIEDKGVLLNLDDKGTHKLKCGNSLEEDDKVQLADERLCHHLTCDSAALNDTCRCALSSGNSLSYSDCQCNNHQPVQCKNTPDHACSGSKICHQLTATKNNHRLNNRQTNTTVHQNLEMKSICTGKGIRVQNGRTKTYIDHDKNGPVDTFLREDKYAFQGNHRDENGTGHSDDGGEGSRSGEAWKGWAIETSGEIRTLLEREHGGVWRSQVLHVEHVKQYAPHVHHLVLDLKCTPNTSGNNNSIFE